MPYLNRRETMYSMIIILILGTASFYFILSRIQLNIETSQFGQDKCTADLDKARFQLSVISDYKNRIDKVLSDTKKAYDSDKKRFKDILDSCMAMKQQWNFCQSQFEELQLECTTVREELSHAIKEFEKYKNSKTGG